MIKITIKERIKLENIIEFCRRNPTNFLYEFCGVKLRWWQKVLLKILSKIQNIISKDGKKSNGK